MGKATLFIARLFVMHGYRGSKSTMRPFTRIICEFMLHGAANCKCKMGGSHEVRVKHLAVKCGLDFSRSPLDRRAPSPWYGRSLVRLRRVPAFGNTSIRFSA